MGYGVIIRHRDVNPDEFREKAHKLKGLAMEICEDTEAMFEEFGERGGMGYRGGYGERSTYGHRSGYGERGMYPPQGNMNGYPFDPYEMQERYRRY